MKVKSESESEVAQSCPILPDPAMELGSLTFWADSLLSVSPGMPQPNPSESESEVTQSCLTLSDPMDCSLPGSSVHGIFQAKVLEWGAIAFSEAC